MILLDSFEKAKLGLNYLLGKEIKLVNKMETNLNSFLIHNFPLKKQFNTNFHKCIKENCKICYFGNFNLYLKLTNNFLLPILDNSTCSSLNVIYILSCNRCPTFYIGQTTNFKRRLQVHINSIKNNKTTSNCTTVMNHFNTMNHDLDDITFTIFNVNTEPLMKRLNLETQLIHLFKNLNVNLLNEKIPDKNYHVFYNHLFLKD
jgi:hypothetical protein